MRITILILPALALLSGCPQSAPEHTPQPTPAGTSIVTKPRPLPGQPAKAELVTSKFKVDGMDCKDCSKAIEAKLIGTPGVSTVSADAKAGRVIVQYDKAKVSKMDIIAAIDALKFRASIIE